MRIVFFGTPAFALEPLNMLFYSKHEVVAVVTQPDRAKNRRGEYVASDVKKFAQLLKIPVLQFESVRKEGVQILKDLNADVFVSAAYGQIFSQEIIDIPKYGILNVHASLLPLYRGSSPAQWALINGETHTGVTIMQTDVGLDTGDILLSQKLRISDRDTTDWLLQRLSDLGATLLITTLSLIEAGQIKPVKQDESKATKCPMITRQMGKIDWNNSARQIFNRIRAIDCHTFIGGKYVKILESKIVDENSKGTAGELSDELVVQCGEGKLEITKIQPENKRAMRATEYLLGNKPENGTIIG